MAAARLGLSIVAAIVAVHNGRVEAHPGPNGGAAFIVRLPVVGTLRLDDR